MHVKTKFKKNESSSITVAVIESPSTKHEQGSEHTKSWPFHDKKIKKSNTVSQYRTVHLVKWRKQAAVWRAQHATVFERRSTATINTNGYVVLRDEVGEFPFRG